MQHVNSEASPAFRGLLDKWAELNSRALASWDGDVPWRYNERATLSFLAGAVWKLGGWAIEEFETEKRRATGSWYFGRCDLWFELGETEYYAEAKFCHPSLNPSGRPAQMVRSCLDLAVADARKLKQYSAAHVRCGLAFSIPVLDWTKPVNQRLGTDSPRLQRQVEAWKSAIESAGGAHAWVLRDLNGWDTYPDGHRPHLMYPGVGVIIQPIDALPTGAV